MKNEIKHIQRWEWRIDDESWVHEISLFKLMRIVNPTKHTKKPYFQSLHHVNSLSSLNFPPQALLICILSFQPFDRVYIVLGDSVPWCYYLFSLLLLLLKLLDNLSSTFRRLDRKILVIFIYRVVLLLLDHVFGWL